MASWSAGVARVEKIPDNIGIGSAVKWPFRVIIQRILKPGLIVQADLSPGHGKDKELGTRDPEATRALLAPRGSSAPGKHPSSPSGPLYVTPSTITPTPCCLAAAASSPRLSSRNTMAFQKPQPGHLCFSLINLLPNNF
uniref:uncharacterized protein LOC143395745 n=1 Tax=Callospermophilus lateralis TaxID=76772 RepID=UPI00403866B7